mgnify:CR=1 FL=1
MLSVKSIVGMVIGILMFILACVAAGMIVFPIYGKWTATMRGQAEYQQAEANRKIKVLEAEAHREAAKSLAQAEIERAKGVAEANRIIGDSLKENEAYLRYLWISGLRDGRDQVIYVPTEAGLPILESGRHLVPHQQ